MLFDPDQHEPVSSTLWNEDPIRAAMRDIVGEGEDGFGGETWPVHPVDAAYTRTKVYATHGLWTGAAGILWALHALAQAGAVSLRHDCALGLLPGSPELDGILLESGEPAWRAGPLRKGPGLCHGTAGTGFAFLTLYRRTGDDVWLERARSFAVHSLEQVERARAKHGQARFSLWTGDLGAALFGWQCISGTASFPTIDWW